MKRERLLGGMALLLLLLLSSCVFAQVDIYVPITTEGLMNTIRSTSLVLGDPTITPTTVPSTNDFQTNCNGHLRGEGFMSNFGVNTSFEVSSKHKNWVVAPFYNVTSNLCVEVRLPYILRRTMEYYDHNATAGGIGDVSFDAGYTWPFADSGNVFHTRLYVKLPTGDSEAEDGGYLVPLGTGSLDLLISSRFVKDTYSYSLLGNVLFRKNGVSKKTVQVVDSSDPSHVVTTDYDITNGDMLCFSTFGRLLMSPRWEVWLGAGAMIVRSGETKFTTIDPQVGTPEEGRFSNEQGMTLLDLYPGFTYSLGVVRPYFGLKIPVVSSYEGEEERESRDLVFILQLSYQAGQ